MNRDLILRLAAEVSSFWVGVTIQRVLSRPHHGLALLPADEQGPALDISPLAPHSWVAVTGIRLRADDASGSSGRAAMSRALPGRRFLAVHVLRDERIVRLSFDDGGALMVELLGTAGNVYLLDGAGEILDRLRRTARPGGVLDVGQAWRPPAMKDGSPPSATQVWELPDPALKPGLPGLLTPVPTRQAEPLDEAVAAAVMVCADGPGDSGGLFERAETLGDAVLRQGWLRDRHDQARRLFGEWQRRLNRESRRLKRLHLNLNEEVRAVDGHAALRRQGESLAAGLSRSRRQGLQIVVPDLYSTHGATLTIDLQPGESPQQATDRIFRRARRLQRAEERVLLKLIEAEERLQQVEALRVQAGELTHLDDLKRVLKEAPAWLRENSKGSTPSSVKSRTSGTRRKHQDPRERKVKRYALGDDWHVLVGGEATVNDFVSFRMAAPADFWFHVADYPGAHVVVRNPRRLPQLPGDILRQAAGIAVWFSRARDRGPVDVRWVQARYLRKGKGLPPGMVLLPRSSTLSAAGTAPPRQGVP